MTTSKLQHTQDRIAKSQAILKKLLEVEKKLLAKTLVKCSRYINGNRGINKGCGAEHPIDSLEYIQTHWYTEPHGCTGGDYWNQGEGNWICPSCGGRNRLYDHPEIIQLKHLFNSVADEYGR